jgi:Family of unknown function (DUF5947)
VNSALRRLAQRPDAPPAPEERCDLCGEPLPAAHRHLFDLDTGRAECACRGCAILFDRGAAGGDHYKLIPQRRVRLDVGDRALAALGVPVDLVFVTLSSRTGAVEARYPSPVGLTVHTVAPDAWALIGVTLEPDVEALLLHRARERWIVPVDDCFRLAALLREHWSGLTGGDAVWREIDRFFADLEETT